MTQASESFALVSHGLCPLPLSLMALSFHYSLLRTDLVTGRRQPASSRDIWTFSSLQIPLVQFILPLRVLPPPVISPATMPSFLPPRGRGTLPAHPSWTRLPSPPYSPSNLAPDATCSTLPLPATIASCLSP